MVRIITGVLAALTALLLAATMAPAQAAAPAAPAAAPAAPAAAAARCFRDLDSPGTQRDIQICVSEPGNNNVFNFGGRVSQHGRFKLVKLQYRPTTKWGGCPLNRGWRTIKSDKTNTNSMYSFKGIRARGCYRAGMPASQGHAISYSERIRIVVSRPR